MSLPSQFLTKTTRYALAASTALASLGPGERVASADLAERTQVPRAFLGKVLIQLAKAGIVDGVKGHGGGYRLARPPSEITLSEVVEAIHDEEDHGVRPCALGAKACDAERPCAVHERWTAIRTSLHDMLRAMTVAQAAEREKGGTLPA